MADMDLQIRITSATGEAIESLDQIAESFRDIQKEGTIAAATFNLFESASKSVGKLAKQLDEASKSLKKFGRDFTQNVTIPIVALAGLSLKKVFDEAVFSRGTTATNEFAASVQSLKKSFDGLLISIGTELAPAATAIANALSSLIKAFQELDKETKTMLINFGLIAAAFGPIALGFSTFLGITSKILIAVKLFVSEIGLMLSSLLSVGAVIGTVVLSVVGLIGIFQDLRRAGEGVGPAIVQTLQLAGSFINKYFTSYILLAIQKITDGLGYLVGFVSQDMAKALAKASSSIAGVIDNMDKTFDSALGGVNEKLSKIGSSAANAFTFGLANQIAKQKAAIQKIFSDATTGNGSQVERKMTDEEKEAAKEREDAQKKAIDQIRKDVEAIQALQNQITSNISTGMANAFLDIADGAKSAEQAFADFARSTIRYLTQMILQAQIFNMLNSFSGFQAATGGAANAAQMRSPGFADGGFVTGPGTSRSDSIMARLSNGEFVNDAKTVKTFGVGFFANLKKLARSGVSSTGGSGGIIPGFANGGLVSSSAGAPQVVIQNSGNPKEATGTSFDPSTLVTTVFLDDLQKNGRMSKAMQSTFGTRRTVAR